MYVMKPQVMKSNGEKQLYLISFSISLMIAIASFDELGVFKSLELESCLVYLMNRERMELTIVYAQLMVSFFI